jgi:hypothetical protein
MHMAVDAPGHHDKAGGVDLARRSLDALGNGGDAAAPHADVGAEGVARGGDGAAADGEIKVRHDGLRRRSGPNAGGSRARSLSIFRLVMVSRHVRPSYYQQFRYQQFHHRADR